MIRSSAASASLRFPSEFVYRADYRRHAISKIRMRVKKRKQSFATHFRCRHLLKSHRLPNRQNTPHHFESHPCIAHWISAFAGMTLAPLMPAPMRFRGATSSLVLALLRSALSAAGPGDRRRQTRFSA